MFDFDRLAVATLKVDPFEHVIVSNFLGGEKLFTVCRAFPDLRAPGLFPISILRCPHDFARLIEAMHEPRLSHAFEEKFRLPLVDRPMMITVRGFCQAHDGAVHTDSRNKLISALLYLNEGWGAAGGRLRLLRSDCINDVAAEVPPEAGTLVAFRRSDRSFHGHLPFVGPRRYVMLNWLVNDAVAARETARHRLSASVKRLAGLRA
jgi:SM-20-related protein